MVQAILGKIRDEQPAVVCFLIETWVRISILEMLRMLQRQMISSLLALHGH